MTQRPPPGSAPAARAWCRLAGSWRRGGDDAGRHHDQSGRRARLVLPHRRARRHRPAALRRAARPRGRGRRPVLDPPARGRGPLRARRIALVWLRSPSGCPGPQHRQPRGGDHRPHAADREVRRPRAQRPVVRGSRPRRRVRCGGARQQPRRRLRPARRDRHPRQLPRAGLLTVGAGADREAAEAPLQLELNGVRIAFVAATEGNLGRGRARPRRRRRPPQWPGADGRRPAQRGRRRHDRASARRAGELPPPQPAPGGPLPLLRRCRGQRRDRPPSAPARRHRDPLGRADRVRHGELPLPDVLPVHVSRVARGLPRPARLLGPADLRVEALSLLPVARAADRRADVSGGGAASSPGRSRRAPRLSATPT